MLKRGKQFPLCFPAAFRSVWWTSFLQLFWNNDVWMRQWLMDYRAAGILVAPFFQGAVWESSSGQGRCTGYKNKQPFIGMREWTLLLHSLVVIYQSGQNSSTSSALNIAKNVTQSIISIHKSAVWEQAKGEGCVLVLFTLCRSLFLLYFALSSFSFSPDSPTVNPCNFQRDSCFSACKDTSEIKIYLSISLWGVLLRYHMKIPENDHGKHTEKMCKSVVSESCVLSESVASRHLDSKLSWHLYVSENSH